jgi:hypothetical protein
MRAADLSKVWGAPDNSRLSKRQQSFRLPVHVAAKIEAFCELYPNKSKTAIVSDLLAAALEEAIRNLPFERGQQIGDHPEFGREYAVSGAAADFQRLANKHYKELERELGNRSPGELYSAKLVDFEREPG